MTREPEESLDEYLAKIEAATEQWAATKKPGHLLELKKRSADVDTFRALFRDPDPVVSHNQTIRNVWLNGNPAIPAEIPMLMWHPMVHASMPAKLLWDSIAAAMRPFDIPEVFYWQSETTRWTYLTRDRPSYAHTNFGYRVWLQDDKLFNELEAAS